MPYKTGKMKGELTTPEIRKLIKAHNVLVSIKIPKGATREEIIALVEKNGYKVNHEKQALVPKVEMQRKKTIGLEKAKEITKPKPRTLLQKQKIEEAKMEKEEAKKKGEREIRKKAVEEEKKRAKPKPKSVSIGVGTDETPPQKKREIEAIIRFKNREESISVPPTDEAIQKALTKEYKGFSGIQRVKLTTTQIKEMNDNQKKPIFDVTLKKEDTVIVEAKVEGATNKILSKVMLKKK